MLGFRSARGLLQAANRITPWRVYLREAFAHSSTHLRWPAVRPLARPLCFLVGAGIGGWVSGPGACWAEETLCTWSRHALPESCCEAAPAAMQASSRNVFRFLVADAVEKAAGSVVKLSCVRDDAWHSFESAGSGFIFEPASVLTNAHVVHGARKVIVTLHDGTELSGHVERLDALADIAIVALDGANGRKAPAASLGRSSELRVGEWVAAMGSPGGQLKDTVTVGIVSALLRPSAALGMSARRMTYFQTDCAINGGNSGGPIVNMDGEVVGISTMKAAHLDGVGFAIPIDLAVEMVRQMRQYGKVLRPYLGFKMVSLGPGVLEELQQAVPGFPANLRRGVLLSQIVPKSPAARAGLQPGDVLVAFDGSAVVQAAQVHSLLGNDVGRSIPLKVVRVSDGRARLLDVTVVSEPEK